MWDPSLSLSASQHVFRWCRFTALQLTWLKLLPKVRKILAGAGHSCR
jgi:hypothetical protein